MTLDEQTSRRSFLRQLGVTLAAGVGAVAFPGIARGKGAGTDGVFECCVTTTQCPSLNCGSQFKWWCDCQSYTYCVCRSTGGNCQPAQC